MARKTAPILGFVLEAFMWSCNGSTGPAPHPFTYPLAAGNSWTYDLETIWEYQDDRVPDTIRSTVFVQVEGSWAGGPGTFSHWVRSTHTTDFGVYMGDYWYRQDGESLRYFGSCGTNSEGFPRRTSINPPLPIFGCSMGAPHGPSPTDADSVLPDCWDIVYRDEPYICLDYPLRIGGSWAGAGDPFPVTHSVVSWERVMTPAGKFWSYRIEREYGASPDLSMVEHVAEEGLVKRVSIVHDLVVTTPEYDPDVLELADVTATLSLRSFEKLH